MSLALWSLSAAQTSKASGDAVFKCSRYARFRSCHGAFLFGSAESLSEHSQHRVRHAVSKQATDYIKGGQSALVLNCIMQKRRDGLILISSDLQNEGGDAHQIGYVRDVGSLARLVVVQSRREVQSQVETMAEKRHVRLHRTF